MQETGIRNGAFGADKFGLKNLKQVHWNLGAPQLYQYSLAAGEAVLSNRTSAPTPVISLAAPRRTSSSFATPPPRRFGGPATSRSPRSIRSAVSGLPQACRRQDALRAGPLRRRRSELADQDPRLHRARMAFAVHPQPADSSRGRRPAGLRAGTDDHRLSELQGRSRNATASLRDGDRDRFHPQDRPDRRHALRRRDEEGGVHHAELSSCPPRT